MLDPQRFLRGTVVSGPEQLAPVMVRRLKSDLTALGTEGFPTRRLVQIDLVHGGSSWQARTLREDQPAATRELGGGEAVEVQLSALLARYTELACPAKGRGRLVFINLQKRLLSSVEAFARTLEKHALSVGASRLDLEGAPELDLEDGISSDVEDERMERQVAAATTALPAPEKEAAQLLEQLRRLAQRHRSSADAKARALIAWIREHLCPAASLDEAPRGASKGWTARRLIVFTEYGHTKTYLRKLLESAIEGTDRAQDRIRVFDGGMSEDNRALLQEEFNGDPNAYPVRILIATDAAREGVNLQGYCSDLFHYDIPWNPGRLEQRNGRIDRTLAFEDEVRCHYFFYPQRAEDEVLRAVVRKVGQIQHDLGSVGAVVFDGIADTLERTGIQRSVLGQLEQEEQRVRASSRAAQELEEARAEGLDKEIQQAERLLNESKKLLDFDAKLLREAIDVGLAWAGAEPLAPAPSPAEEPDLIAYRLPELGPTWAATLDSARPARRRDESLEQWRKRPPMPVVFESPRKLSTPVVQLHLKHPIIQRLLARFLAQGYSAHDLARVTVVRNPKDAVPRVIALGRLSIFGHSATRLHDEVLAVAAAVPAKGKLQPFGEKEDRAAIERLEELLATSPTLSKIPAKVQETLRAQAGRHFSELWHHVEQEADARAHDAESLLHRRGRDESRALAKIIQAQIRLADKTLDQQLSFEFSDAEREQREQRKRDRKHISERRAALAVEAEEEPKAILKSYEVLRRRVEPIGLVYLWPTTR
jgi:hypothetical protein